MGQKLLIDTNIVIDYLGGKLNDKALTFIQNIDVVTISAVVEIELLGWYNATEKQLEMLHNFVSTTQILPINKQVIQQTILIRQRKKIQLGDAIIAATAIVNNCTLITRNTNDFLNIEKLQVLNPWE